MTRRSIPPDRVGPTDAAKCGYCPSGLRRWARANNFPLQKFIDEGMTEAELLEYEDEFVRRVIRAWKGEGL